MTWKKIRDAAIQVIVNTILTIGGLLLIFGMERGERKDTRLQEEIELKADKIFVQEQDLLIRGEFESYKQSQSELHESRTELLQSMDRKIDILLQNR
jgi:hypothetical protein